MYIKNARSYMSQMKVCIYYEEEYYNDRRIKLEMKINEYFIKSNK